MGLLPPVVATLVADTKEYSAKMAEAQGQMEEFAGASDTAGAKFAKFGNILSDAVLGAAAAVAAFSIDEGVKFQDSMDALQNATGMTDAQIKKLEGTILSISNVTGASTADLATSMANIEQAGIHGAAATTLLDDAAKAALATNTNVTSVTQSLIAVQALHLKGTKDLTAATGTLVAGSHNFVGGLGEEVSMLQGKVGAAFSEYGFSLKQAITYGSIFSKVGLPTRSIATLATGLGKLLDPIHTVTDSNGKLEHGLSSTYLAIQQLGLKYNKITSDVKTGNLADLLLYLKDVAAQTNEPLTVLLNTVLGSGGAISGSLLLKNLGAVKEVSKGIAGSGSNSLQTAFETASEQFGNKMHIIENQLKNSAAEFGLKLLPYIADAATFLENAMQHLEAHPAEQKALEIDLGVTVAAALGVKIAQALQSTVQTGLLTKIAANTTVLATEGGVGDAEGGAGGLSGAVGKGSLVAGAGIGAFLLTTEALHKNFLGLGTAVTDVTGMLFKLDGAGKEGTTRLAGKTKTDLKYGAAGLSSAFANGSDRQGLAEEVLRYLQNKAAGGNGKVTIKHTTKVSLK